LHFFCSSDQPVNPQNKPQFLLSTPKPKVSVYSSAQKAPKPVQMRPMMKPYMPVSQPLVPPAKSSSAPSSYNAPTLASTYTTTASVNSASLAQFKQQVEALLQNYEANIGALYSNATNPGLFQESVNGSEYSEADHYTGQELTGNNCKGQDVITFPPPDEGLSNHCGTSLSSFFSSSPPYLVRVNNKGKLSGQGFVMRYVQTLC
jgi:hypothetical protein